MNPSRREFYMIIEQDEDGYYVGEVPQLRACYSQGRTIDELMANIKVLETFRGWLVRRKEVDIRKIYKYALQREHEGKRFFAQNAKRLSHAAAVGVFERLAAEEQKHIEFIQAQLDALDEGKAPDTALGAELEREGFFSQRADSEMLDQTMLEAMVPDLPVLRMAYLIERDFAEFYEMAAGKSEGEAKAVLTMLAEWERGHERLFKRLHDKAFEEYAEMPWGG